MALMLLGGGGGGIQLAFRIRVMNYGTYSSPYWLYESCAYETVCTVSLFSAQFIRLIDILGLGLTV